MISIKKLVGKNIGKRDFVLNNKTYKENVYFYEDMITKTE